jgi:predicted RNase H-like nuclease (RuvC/YqgF family)
LSTFGVLEHSLFLLFSQLNAQKKEVVDTDALLERYRKEIEELKQRLAEREREAETPENRRLSAREVSSHSVDLCVIFNILFVANGRV